MKHAITRLIRTRPTVAMLAMGMLWMGSTQGLYAQTERSDGGESSRSKACSVTAVAGVGIHRNRLGHPCKCRHSLCGRREVYP
jgi:hypothetical protein